MIRRTFDRVAYSDEFAYGPGWWCKKPGQKGFLWLCDDWVRKLWSIPKDANRIFITAHKNKPRSPEAIKFDRCAYCLLKTDVEEIAVDPTIQDFLTTVGIARTDFWVVVEAEV